MKRRIVFIDEELCNGCGACVPNCVEGAIKIINGKARLLDAKFCDGLGACLGHCPQNAIRIIEQDAPEFDVESVKKHLNAGKQKEPVSGNTIHLRKGSGHHACPGSKAMDFRGDPLSTSASSLKQTTELRQWPVQLTLVSPQATYFQDADLLVAADCVPFAYPGFHSDFLAGRSVVIGCPKLDDTDFYIDKLTDLIMSNNIRSITIVNMEVPCCFGLQRIVEEAVHRSGKAVPVGQTVITIKGEKQ